MLFPLLCLRFESANVIPTSQEPTHDSSEKEYTARDLCFARTGIAPTVAVTAVVVLLGAGAPTPETEHKK